MIYYGTKSCPHCQAADQEIAKRGISCEFVDILESTDNLRAFFKVRDHHPAFDSIKAQGLIGIPCFVEDDGTVKFSL